MISMMITRDSEPILVEFEAEFDRFDEQYYPVKPAYIVGTEQEIELSQEEWDRAFNLVPKAKEWLFGDNFLEKY